MSIHVINYTYIVTGIQYTVHTLDWPCMAHCLRCCGYLWMLSRIRNLWQVMTMSLVKGSNKRCLFLVAGLVTQTCKLLQAMGRTVRQMPCVIHLFMTENQNWPMSHSGPHRWNWPLLCSQVAAPSIEGITRSTKCRFDPTTKCQSWAQHWSALSSDIRLEWKSVYPKTSAKKRWDWPKVNTVNDNSAKRKGECQISNPLSTLRMKSAIDILNEIVSTYHCIAFHYFHFELILYVFFYFTMIYSCRMLLGVHLFDTHHQPGLLSQLRRKRKTFFQRFPSSKKALVRDEPIAEMQWFNGCHLMYGW